MQKIFPFILAAACIPFLSCSKKHGGDQPLTLLMAELNPPESLIGQVDQAFAEKVAELSNGKIKINLQCSGILGDESKVMEMIVEPDSSIQLARVSASLASYGGEKSKLITIPYTFSNSEHFWKFADSNLADEILDEPYERGLGVKGIFYAEEGFRHFFSVSKLASIKDLEGKKTRTSNSATLESLIKAMKAAPVTVPFADLYASLQTGQAEVAEQPLSNYYSNGFHIVAPNVILDGHMLGAVQVLINSKCWDSLSESQRQILKEAGRHATHFCRRIVERNEEEIIRKLEKEGVKITKVSDISPWREACGQMIKDSSKKFPDLYKSILDLDKLEK